MTVREFDSFEEAMQAIADARDAANARLHRKQQDLTWGSVFAAFHPAEGLIVFGRCLPEDEADTREKAAGATAAEARESAKRLRELHADGYLFSECASLAEPGGELGDVHRYDAWPIPGELYDAAGETGWDPTRLPPVLLRQLGDAYEEYRQHRLRNPL